MFFKVAATIKVGGSALCVKGRLKQQPLSVRKGPALMLLFATLNGLSLSKCTHNNRPYFRRTKINVARALSTMHTSFFLASWSFQESFTLSRSLRGKQDVPVQLLLRFNHLCPKGVRCKPSHLLPCTKAKMTFRGNTTF